MNFDRICSTIDIDAMQNALVVMVGGAYKLILNLIRCGLGAVVLIDFDTIDPTNSARQDLNSNDQGKYKVDVIANAIRQINPEVEVTVLKKDFCKLSRGEIDDVVGPSDLLIMGTDFFPAQAKGNKEALRLGIPAIFIGLYGAGRAGEIIYYVPGLTPACYRCICSSRYIAFQNGQTSISSDGGTIFDLHLVDSIAGQISLSILTNGADNRMGKLISKLGNRNLLQIKIDPDYRMGDKDIFGKYLGNHPANFSWTTIALPMEPEKDCPDCSALSIGV